MNSEQRLDRLENIAKLFVRAGLRFRRNLRELDEKINMLINAQIKNEEFFARNEERFAMNEKRFAMNEERFARFETRMEISSARIDERFALLAESQANTDRRLNALIELYKKRSNGGGLEN
jgi:predicted nuclease with TOPRIM domain